MKYRPTAQVIYRPKHHTIAVYQTRSQTTPIGGGQNWGGGQFAGKNTQLTVTVMGGATVFRVVAALDLGGGSRGPVGAPSK